MFSGPVAFCVRYRSKDFDVQLDSSSVIDVHLSRSHENMFQIKLATQCSFLFFLFFVFLFLF